MEKSPQPDATIIRSDQAAVVVDPDGKVSLVIPRYVDMALTPAHRLLFAIALRIDDPEWVEEVLVGIGAKPDNK